MYIKAANLLAKICLSPSASILSAIESLNNSKLGVVLVCDDHGRLLGTITDADIRSGLASKRSLEESVLVIANKQTTTLPFGASNNEIAKCFIDTKLRAIPILDLQGVVVDCLFLDQLAPINKTQRILMIMAGGFGLRMGDLTKTMPKPMLPIKGRPMLEYIVEQAAKEKFERIFISTHYLSKKIKDHFNHGESFNIPIDYIDESEPLDTAGSFANIPISVGPVLVSNADVMTNVGYAKLIDFHNLNDADITVAVHTHIIKHPFGVIKSSGIDLIEIEEKPNWITSINAGIYVLDAKVKSLISKNESLPMTELISRVQKNDGRVIVFPLHEHWIDLGSQTDYYSYKD